MPAQLLAGSLGALMISSLALAQTSPSSSPNATAPNAPPSGTSQPGVQAVNTATMAVRFITAQPADFLSSNLVGTNVYNNQNETIGEIEDLVIDNGKALRAIVIGV